MFTNVSPKVTAGAVTALVLGSLVAGIGAVTPGLLSSLGPWAPVAFAAITALGVGVQGYIVTDPVRAAGELAAATPPPAQTAAPTVVDPAPVVVDSTPAPDLTTPAP